MTPPADQFRTLQAFVQELPLFQGLTSADVDQLCQASRRISAAVGTSIIREGEPGDSLFLVLEGKLEVSKREGDQDLLLAVRGPGEVVGEMSLLERGPRSASARAVQPTEMLEIGPESFRAVLEKNPDAAASILRTMAGRLRSTEASLMQREKLASLGTLAAGLAHELNNPSAAIQRSSLVLRDAFDSWLRATVALQALSLTPEERAHLTGIEAQITGGHSVRQAATAAGREEEALIDLLQDLGLPTPWDLAPPLVAYGWTAAKIVPLADAFKGDALVQVIAWLGAGLAVQQLIEEILLSSATISGIVRAVKSYAYLDQAPVKEIDVAAGIEDTLTILHHKLKYGIDIQRDIAVNLPRVEAYAGELNQVWTNLIDNAVQAMSGKGVLEIHVRHLGERIEVRIADDGPGMPPAVITRIFDPFFTTKPQGVGTGLGLHIARNIVVNRHRGRIDVSSRPGRTEFTVLLPLILLAAANEETRGGMPRL